MGGHFRVLQNTIYKTIILLGDFLTIYLDLIFLENVFMNSIIIYATVIILKKEIKILRILLGSIIGAIYACVYYISNMKIYSNIILKIILSLVIVYISFGSKGIKEFLRELLIFYLTSFTFGGVTFALLYFISPGNILFKNGSLVGIYPLKMILIGGLIGFFIIIISFKSIKNKLSKKDMLCNISIVFEKGKVDINAIIDTGNFLKEPITGKPVIIVEKDVLKNVIPVDILENSQDIINGEKIEDKYMAKIRLIPFSALGTENGLLLGIKPDDFYINYQGKILENKNVIVGIYNKKLSKNNRYNALVGLDIINT